MTTPTQPKKWYEYLNAATDIATGVKSPNFEFSLDNSTIAKMALGLFGAVFISLLMNQLLTLLFRKA